jgi:HEAT repeat protein
MSGPERLEGANPQDTVATRADALTGALQSLYHAYQKTFVYPPDPPAVPDALTRVVSGLEVALAGGNEIIFDIEGGQLLVDGELCAEMDAAVRSLAGLLHDLNLEALEFSTGLTVKELECFVEELGRAKREGCKGSSFVDQLRRADLERVRARALGDDASQVDQPARRPPDERTAAFIAGLGPRLRRDLMRVDVRLPEESLAPSEPEEEGPGSDLLDTLRELDSGGARLPGQLLTLLNKLVRTSQAHYTLTSGLHERLASWKIPPEALSSRSGSLRPALLEIFQARSHAHFIPPPHRSLLDRLSRSKLEPTDFDLMERYRDPGDVQDVRLQASQVAVRLVGGRGGEKHRAGIFAFLALAAEFLIERGQFDAVHDAAVSARTYSLLKSEPESTRRAARGFLEEFRSEERIRLILKHACSSERLSPDALNLLSLGGATALDCIVKFLVLRPPARIAQALVRFVASRSGEQLDELLQARLSHGWTALRPVLPIVASLPPLQAVPLLESLLGHEECRVRRLAYAALMEFDRPPGAATVSLRRALSDESPRVVALAIRQLSRMDAPDALELLGAYVECGLEGVTPRPGFARCAARNLLDRGEEGLKRLMRCLETLGRTPQRLHVTLARVVLDALRSLRDDRRVAKCVRRWKLSPAGLLSLAVRRTNGSGARNGS